MMLPNPSKFWKALPADVQWGLLWGAGVAGFFSAIAVSMWLVGLLFTGSNIFASMIELDGKEYGVTIAEVLVFYWGGGVVGGSIAGWFRSFAARSYLGAAIVGMVVAAATFPIFAVVTFGASGWSTTIVYAWIGAIVICGPYFGVLFKWRHGGELQKDSSGQWRIDRR